MGDDCTSVLARVPGLPPVLNSIPGSGIQLEMLLQGTPSFATRACPALHLFKYPATTTTLARLIRTVLPSPDYKTSNIDDVFIRLLDLGLAPRI